MSNVAERELLNLYVSNGVNAVYTAIIDDWDDQCILLLTEKDNSTIICSAVELQIAGIKHSKQTIAGLQRNKQIYCTEMQLEKEIRSPKENLSSHIETFKRILPLLLTRTIK